MFPTRRARTPLALLPLGLLAALTGGCGGASTPRTTLPAEELAVLTLMPRDAFLAGRLDVGELRATPHWAELMEKLRADEPALVEFAEGTRHVYFGIGGLVDMPPLPPLTDEQGVYQPRPAWVEWSERFGGHVPASVVIIEGAGAGICAMAVAEHEHQTQGGYEVTDLDGVAILRRGTDLCALTFTPMVSALLGQPEGHSDIAHQLGSEAPATVARVALQLDSPTVSALLDLLGQPDPGEGPEVLPDSITEEEAENYRAEMARLRETELRRAEFVRSAIRIVADGLTSVAWQVAADSEGFETRTHVAGLDASRLGMWRELSQMFFDILTAAVRTDTLPSDDGSAAEFVRSVRIDETDDGYVIVRHTRHQTIARLLTEMLPGPAGTVFEEVRPPVPEPVPEAIELMHTAIADGTPAEIIGAVEPNLELVRSWMNPYDQHTFVTALINAYGVRGRYDEAAALVDQSLEAARASSTEDQDAMWRSQAAHATVCPYAATACELHLAQGHAERALAATQTSNPDEERTCSQQSFPVSSCASAALAALGRVDEGLAQLEMDVSNVDTLDFLVARVRVLVLGGRVEQAHVLARDVCIGGPSGGRCDSVLVVLAESLALGAVSWAAAEPTFTAVGTRLGHIAGPSHPDRVRFEAASCAVRARLDGAAEATRSVCAAGLESAIAYHGESHFRVAAIRMSYARALERARMRSEAAAQRAAAQPIIDGLGPQHPLRARPAR
jgi:hypothetical protein